jgi:predicted O-methyltransferase YrrM
MTQERWDAVDDYIARMLLGEDPVLEEVTRTSAEAGLPPIALSPPQAKFLYLLARVHQTRSILELGTLGGYSTIWLARALPADGRLVTLEINADYAAVAAANTHRAGVAGPIQIKIQPALDGLRELIADDAGPFDLIFIDADKEGTPEYFRHALSLSRPGTVIVTDNVVRGGALADPDTEDPRARGMRRFHEVVAAESRVSATTIQTVGSKGYDGFTLVLVER